MVLLNDFILNMTKEDVLKEMSFILQKEVKPVGREKIGFITETPEDYFINNETNEEKLKEIYNNSSYLEDYAVTLAINSIYNRPKDLFNHITKNINQDSKVLDFGCGVGTHGIACKQKSAHVEYYDISKFMLNIATQRYNLRGLTAIRINKENHLSGPYNFIICTDVIEHVKRPLELIKKFYNILSEDGILHLHISKHICLERGHLPESIKEWDSRCLDYLEKNFIKLSNNNYQKK